MQARVKQSETAPKFIGRRDLAARWSVSIETLKRHEKLGRLPSYRLGQQARYALADVEKIEAAARIA